MGLYSTVRPAPVLEAADLQLLSKLDEAVNEPIESFSHMLEFVIQLHENDQMLFDSLLECDFISAVNVNTLLEAEAAEVESQSNEVKKSKIMEKISAVLQKLKEALIKAGQAIIAKINDLIKADEKIYETYKNVLTPDNLKGYEGIVDFAFPAAVSGNSLLSKISDAVNKFGSKAQGSKENVDSAFAEYEESMKSLTDQMNAETAFGFQEKVAKFVPDSSQIAESLNCLKNSNTIINKVKGHIKEIMGNVKDLEAWFKSVLKSKTEKSEIDTYLAMKVSNAVSLSAKTLASEFSAYQRVVVKQIAAYRKVVILCGRYASKTSNANAKETGTALAVQHNSALDWMLGEASDNYVYEAFGF